MPETFERKTIAILVVGMAGSGKTSFIQRFNSSSHAKKMRTYIVNIDPAATKIPYVPNIDIRDTINFKKVMKDYGLGPNGAILTAANLFATRFDQVISLCERRRSEIDFIVIDTPGQIEIFTWSASGTIVTEAVASRFRTFLFYVLDTSRSNNNPQVFVSNMLQAISVLYKSRVKLILLLNKVDITNSKQIRTWLSDFEKFQAAFDIVSNSASELGRSLGFIIEEFYARLSLIDISCRTGEGFEDVFELLRNEAGL